ncbi:DNA mismatch repair protein MutS [Geodia barretti]|uniref:DNA mismatch repair protein MutS n=1 Tax=Geodia barretti TaxID=519541 RepID=A0AA35W0Y8_GEOBA|nr:DNA mismatch repair protein MutS [Geodia barretti]
MCGVPVVSAEGYLQRLIRKGFKVAVCEQVEDPAEARKRGAKAVVRREVIRLLTPGTLSEDALLDARAANYLAALAQAEGALALAWAEMSTGEFAVMGVLESSLPATLARFEPGELLVPEPLLEAPSALRGIRRALAAFYGIASLDGLGSFSRAELAAAGAVLGYLRLTQKGQLPRLARLRSTAAGAAMAIDAATRRNLELTATLEGGAAGSLLAGIDRTVSGAGARLLRARLTAPLTDPDAIAERLDSVGFLVEAEGARHGLRERLRRCPDMERALSRLSLGRGGPRDLAAVRDALGQIPAIRALAASLKALGHHQTLVDRLTRALVESPPPGIRDGGIIARGYDTALDEVVELRDHSRRLVGGLEARYRSETGVGALKVRHNNVLGYYVEVPPQRAKALPEAFIHRQTLASAVRYTTVELGELEARINGAAEKALALEQAHFDDLRADVVRRADDIARAAGALAVLDVAQGLALLAVERRYVRPVVDRTLAFEIRGGRHPVVEAMGAGGDTPFVPNDCELGDAGRIWLVTGPNMAGKSTFLRQNALIAVLAQMGSFVPADEARIGVVDRLFSRVGAADDLARGRSTFMVEMVETAAILNQAGERALVISMRSGGAPPPMTGSRSPGPQSSTCTIATAAGRSSRPIITSSRRLPKSSTGSPATPCGSRNGRARSCSCTRWRTGRGRSFLRHPRGAPRRLARSGACPRRGGAGAARTGRQSQCCRPARQRPAALPGPPAGGAQPRRNRRPIRCGLASPRSTPTTSPRGMRWSSSTRSAPGSGTMRPRTDPQPCAGIRSGPFGSTAGSREAMKPAPFAYECPSDVAEAVALLAAHGGDARPLAGGQSLVPLLNFRLARPAVLVDLNRIEALARITVEDGALRLGAMARQASVETDARVARGWPLLTEAIGHIAHPQIRNRGTVGGSLAHNDPAAELPAVMLALDAEMSAQGPQGQRTIAARDFFAGTMETALGADELLTEIAVPALPEGTGWGFQEAARRQGDFALVAVAILSKANWLRADRRPRRGHRDRRRARAHAFSGGCPD